MTISTPSNTCPDCGVVDLGYVCGSPDDPSNGQDCLARQGRTACEGCNATHAPLTLVEVSGPFGRVQQVLCTPCGHAYSAKVVRR